MQVQCKSNGPNVSYDNLVVDSQIIIIIIGNNNKQISITHYFMEVCWI